MNRIKLASIGAVGGVLALGTAAAAQLGIDQDDAAEHEALIAAQVDAAQAARTAETVTGHHVSSVELDEEDGGYRWEVETASDEGVEQTVAIDTVSGDVIGTYQDD